MAVVPSEQAVDDLNFTTQCSEVIVLDPPFFSFSN